MAGDGTGFPFQCPLPHEPGGTIQLGHGSGGRLTDRLIREVLYPCFATPEDVRDHDSALIRPGADNLLFTTDSFVVSPRFFPGGDIGALSVNGTVNDLAMSGARPLYLSCAFILEEGLALEELVRIATSMRHAADAVGMQLVTGDTKVVERGKGDGVYINTTGVGLAPRDAIGPQCIQRGDAIVLSGDIGRHGMAVMARREGLEFDNPLESDCAELWSPVRSLLEEACEIHCLRDLTRGGLATALVELAETSGMTCRIEEDGIAVAQEVRGGCEMLGLDPLYVANEGRFVAFLPAEHANRAVEILRDFPGGENAAVIGLVKEDSPPEVIHVNALGSERLLDRLPGEQLPRIC